jgi:ABC-2 type transport system permease protein
LIRSEDNRPLGYVDYSGVLKNATMPQKNMDTVDIIAFANEESARRALGAEDIQGFYILPKDYITTQFVDLYYLEEVPDNTILSDFDDFIRANIVENNPSSIQNRIIKGATLTIHALNDNREFQNNESGIIFIMLPLLIAMFFLFAVLGASGYFLQVVTDEKENRTMEIMITSISPAQMIMGKSVGLVAVGLMQIIIWLASIAIAWIVARHFFKALELVVLPWDILVIFATFFLPSYAIIAGLMICIGSIVTELQEGQQISGVINLLFTFPIFFTALVFANPNSSLLVFLSFWPTTSLMTIMMRWGLTVVPFWHVLLSWIINSLTAIMIIWVASRLFRLGMLRYGQRLMLKSILTAIFPNVNRD